MTLVMTLNAYGYDVYFTSSMPVLVFINVKKIIKKKDVNLEIPY
jgi:hypothetical protein